MFIVAFLANNREYFCPFVWYQLGPKSKKQNNPAELFQVEVEMAEDTVLESAKRHFRQGSFKEAIKLFIKVEKLAKHNDPRLIEVYRGLAESYQSMPSYDLAIEAARQYKRVAAANNRDEEIQRSLVTIGNVYLDKVTGASCYFSERDQSASKARKYLRESIDKIPTHLEERAKREMKARSLLNLYILETAMGNQADAAECFAEGEKTARSERLYADLFRLQITNLRHSLEQEDFSSAENCFQKCKATLKNLGGDERDESFFEFNADLTVEHIRMQARDVEFFSRATNIFRNHKKQSTRRSTESRIVSVFKSVSKLEKRFNEVVVVDASERLSQLYEDIGDIYDNFVIGFKRLALKYYREAEKHCPDENTEKKANLYCTIGAVYEDMSNWSEALKWYAKEIEITKSNDLKPAEDSALGVLRCSILQKDDRNVILQHLKTAYKLATDDDSKSELLRHLNLGSLINTIDLLEDLEKYKPKSNEELALSSDSGEDSDEEEDKPTKYKHVNSKGNRNSITFIRLGKKRAFFYIIFKLDSARNLTFLRFI